MRGVTAGPQFRDTAIPSCLMEKALSGPVSDPLRVCRRLIFVGYTAMGSVSRAAQTLASASAGGIFPMGSGRRRLLNQPSHFGVAYPTASKLRQGHRRWMTSALNI